MIRLASALTALLLPVSAWAHATPTDYAPAAGAALEGSPSEVAIRFTERLEEAASSIAVYAPDGKPAQTAAVRRDPADPRRLTLALPRLGTGSYLVSWRVLSADDGHGTEGAYGFTVGKGTAPAAAASYTITHVVSVADGLASGLEMAGEALFPGVLLLLALAGMVTAADGISADARRRLERRAAWIVCAGCALAVGGTLWYAQRQGVRISPDGGILASLSGVAGRHALARAAGALAFLAAFLLTRNGRGRAGSALLWGLVLLLTYSRARVSHAAASEFLPWLGIGMNAVHLLAKDAWIGTLLASVFALPPLLRGESGGRRLEIFQRALARLLSWALLAGGVTGCFILWLHLKSPAFLLTTEWGMRFLLLSVFAVVLLGLRVRHVFLLPRGIDADRARGIWFWFVLEAAAGAWVLLASGILVVTTPPNLPPRTFREQVVSQGVAMALVQPSDDASLLRLELTDGAGRAAEASALTVTLRNATLGVGPAVETTEWAFPGGYAFPASALAPEGTWTVEAVASRPSAYDVVGRFTVRVPEDLRPRTIPHDLGGFALLCAFAAVLLALLSGWMRHRCRRAGPVRLETAPQPEGASPAGTGGLLTADLALLFALGFGIAGHVRGPFQSLCERNGHAWHESAPARAGVPTAALAEPGCMTGMGAGASHLTDLREYREFIRPIAATVKLSVPEPLRAGETGGIALSIVDKDGKPVTGLVADHDRIVHVMAVGRDLTSFVHAHAEDAGPVTPSMLSGAAFRVPLRLPAAGKYLLGVDYTVRGRTMAETFVTEAAGAPAMTAVPEEPARAWEGDGYEVRLSLPTGGLRAGREQRVSFAVTRAGADVTDLQPYLAAPMHLAIVTGDARKLRHTHGLLPVSPLDSVLHPHMPGMVDHASTPAAFGPRVDAYLTLDEPGRHVIFAEFRHAGAVRVARFAVEVR